MRTYFSPISKRLARKRKARAMTASALGPSGAEYEGKRGCPRSGSASRQSCSALATRKRSRLNEIGPSHSSLLEHRPEKCVRFSGKPMRKETKSDHGAASPVVHRNGECGQESSCNLGVRSPNSCPRLSPRRANACGTTEGRAPANQAGGRRIRSLPPVQTGRSSGKRLANSRRLVE